ncbi:hypothetical protein F5Y06DRAFT_12775 [Hypoxylon sp. FL0890]|nr:hypothetical protein F5Y06DRAFT_12775 [Hypoxylon sp. FL0890]
MSVIYSSLGKPHGCRYVGGRLKSHVQLQLCLRIDCRPNMLTIWSALLLPSLLAGVRAAPAEAPPSDWASKIEVYVPFLLSDLTFLQLTKRRIRNPYYPLDVVDKLEETTMPNVDAWLAKKIAANKNNNCTLENAAVRREWCVFHLYNACKKLLPY